MLIDNVVKLNDMRSHLSGKARCLQCGYEWVAVVPAGITTTFECPHCHTLKGVYENPCIPQRDVEIWTCNCGCDVFHITHESAFCIMCGAEQYFSD